MASISGAYTWGKSWASYGRDRVVGAARGARLYLCPTKLEQEMGQAGPNCKERVVGAAMALRRYLWPTFENTIESGPDLRRRIAQAERGEAPDVETNRITRRWFGCIPCRRTAYVVKDPVRGKAILQQLHRNSAQVRSRFHDHVQGAFGRKNMLTGPHKDHGRQRRPFNRPLSQKSVSENFGALMARVALFQLNNRTDDFSRVVIEYVIHEHLSGRGCLQEAINDHNWRAAQDDQLTQAEIEDTLAMMKIAGQHTTSRFMFFFREAVNSDRQWEKKLFAEWKEFLLKKFPDKAETISALSIATLIRQEDRLAELFGRDKWNQYHVRVDSHEFAKYFHEFVEESAVIEACYQEALRMYPIFPTISRVVEKDCQVRVLIDNVVEIMCFKKGDEIYVSPLAAQRDGRKWKNPDTFDPSRFMGRKAPQWLNFSAGQEMCIGRHLAKLESKIFVARHMLLGHPDDKTPHRLELSHDGIMLSIDAINGDVVL